MQTQNRVTLAEPRLPTEVTQQGIRSREGERRLPGRRSASRSEDDACSSEELNNIVAARVLDPIPRIPGVGSASQFGSEYAMRIWLDPDKLRAYSTVAPTTCWTQVRGQNVQFASGAIGCAARGAGSAVHRAGDAPKGASARPSSSRTSSCAPKPNGTTRAAEGCGAGRARPAAAIGFECDVDDKPVAAFGVQLSARRERARGGKAASRPRWTKCSRASRRASSGSCAFDSTTFINARDQAKWSSRWSRRWCWCSS